MTNKQDIQILDDAQLEDVAGGIGFGGMFGGGGHHHNNVNGHYRGRFIANLIYGFTGVGINAQTNNMGKFAAYRFHGHHHHANGAG